MNGFPALMPWLVKSALCGSVVIVLLLVLRPFVRRWLGARAVHALWLVALVRLLIPWTPHSPMAVLPAPEETRASMDPVMVRAFVVGRHHEEISPPAMISERSPERGAAIPARTIGVIWVVGAMSVFGLSLAGGLRAAPLLRRAREIAPESVAMRILASLPMSVRGLRILETDELKSPALCGWIRPAILLPPGWANSMAPEELRCVLLHEIGHHRRGDVVWRWAFLVVRAIHWFNPLVWVAEREMRIDQEMACDEWTLAQDSGIDPQTYGEALLLACKNLAPLRITSPGHATMAESSAGLAQRIRHIARTKTHGWPALVGTALLAIAFCVIGPSPGEGRDPVTVPGDSPAKPTPAAAPPSVSASTPSPAPEAPAKVGIPSGIPVPPSPAKAQETLVEIEAKFVECSGNALLSRAEALPGDAARSDPVSVLENSQFQVILRGLSQMKGVDLLSAPRVTCKSGQKTVVEMIREFRYPTEFNAENDGTGRATPSAFETRNVGTTLEVVATVEGGGRINMALTPSVVKFAGFVNYGVGRPARRTLTGDALTELMKSSPGGRVINQPVFDVQKIATAAAINSGQTVLLGGISRTGTQTRTDVSLSKRGGKPFHAAKTSEEKMKTYLLIFVTAHILSPETP